MQDFNGKKIILGVCGGIAAYKAAYFLRELIRLGASVQVVMTKAAQEFMTPLTFQALSGKAVRLELFDSEAERAMSHIELARWADYLIIAPASANTLAKLAQGMADDLLTTLYLATKARLFLCPAMNQAMWHHEATQKNLALLQARGAMIIGPEKGVQACGDEGLGRLVEVETIIKALYFQEISEILAGKDVLITAGPTREAIDPVRYLSNHSSGKMGYALAEAAKVAGARVTLITGPTALQIPEGVESIQVESAKEMLEAVLAHLRPGQIFIASAAVADYTPLTSAREKIKKEATSLLNLELEATVDILATVASKAMAGLVVGFAAETSRLIPAARKKLATKGLDLIIANQVGPGLGFGQDENAVTVISQDEELSLPLMPKLALAGKLIVIIASKLRNTDFSR